MRTTLFYFLLSLACTPALAQQDPSGGHDIRLIVRADDMGAAQAVNEACIQAHRDGIVTSVEVLVPGPWFLDAVRLIKENPDIDVGVHLALTSEWQLIKWRPLTHAPSLVDTDGYFRPMTKQEPGFPPDTGFVDAHPKLDEVERELRAQIETAQRHLGKQVSHVSAHMLAARATPELQALTERLAREYGLRMEDDGVKYAGNFGSNTSTPEHREEALVELLERLPPGDWFIVEHPAFDTPEMRGFGHKGYERVAADRAGVTRAYLSSRVREVIDRRGIELVGFPAIASNPLSR
jgi:predicted glycoside hydrolase/deacetylase ChbG (UPF0249 family)